MSDIERAKSIANCYMKFGADGLQQFTGGHLERSVAFIRDTYSDESRMPKTYDIRQFGGSTRNDRSNTAAIQNAIDEAHRNRGGRVEIPAGVFVTGSLELKSGVELFLSEGATLAGSVSQEDYPDLGEAFSFLSGENYSRKSLIWALDAKDIAISGPGTIDGRGDDPAFAVDAAGPFWSSVAHRPHGIYLNRCSRVTIEDVYLQRSAFWMQHYRECEHLTIQRVKVFNIHNHNNDGLDINNCRDVTIRGCHIASSDDAICFKSTSPTLSDRILIEDCVLGSHYNCIKIGTETAGGLSNLTIRDCELSGLPDYPHRLEEGGRTRGFCGLAFMSADGGIVEDVEVANLTATHLQTALFLRLQRRDRRFWDGDPPPNTKGALRRIHISNYKAKDLTRLPSSVTGIPGSPIEEVTLCGVTLEVPGGGIPADDPESIPELEGAYPECNMFGDGLPASGLFARHVRGLKLERFEVRTPADNPDHRPITVYEDVNLSAV